MFLFLITLCVITSIVAEDTMVPIEDQLIVEDDNPYAYKQFEINLIKYLQDKLVQLYAKISSYRTNVATAKGIQKISSEFEILVFGPARVGKSTLIQQISGDKTIVTSAQLDPFTPESKKYIDKYNIHWWDTPGISSIMHQSNIFKLNFYRF